METSNKSAELIFKAISDNDHRKLDLYLKDQGSTLNVVELRESRQYTALAFCAFKGHTHCFRLIYEHGCKYNLPLRPDLMPQIKSL
jgi:hypothetical protein